MKILFVVCGEGLGHASRCLHLGHYMQQQGHTVHFAGYGKSFDFMSQHGCTHIHRIHREVWLEGTNGFFSLKKTLWYSKSIVFDMVRSAMSVRNLIRKYRFDCVVCDTMYGGVIASRLRNVPVIFITNQNHFNGHNGTTNPVWKSLNFLIQRYLRLATHVIIPDYPAPDTVSEYNILVPENERSRYSYTGPFYDFDPSRYTYSKKTIFTSFGGEPYKLPMYLMLKMIADRRKDLFFDVFYTGPVLPESSDNFESHGYVPNLYEHLAEAKIAIVHGGLTTLHEALLFEKPVLIIMDPDHPEQQNNAKKIVDMGAGTSVDGRRVTLDMLEKKIAETMDITPKPFREVHAAINGRKNATDIITAVAARRQLNIRGKS
ncbi:MAG: glycosyltransferase family protein [Methanoregula sp.]|uniref:glycosyltransferase family protein n=1 Tax=Methanoregula sp. TaxID=2052170 RepID=UPI003D149D53